MERRTAVVTGATGGIGRWIALGLARSGCRVVLVGRDRARGEAAQDWIRGQAPGAELDLMVADLSSLAATRALGSAGWLVSPIAPRGPSTFTIPVACLASNPLTSIWPLQGSQKVTAENLHTGLQGHPTSQLFVSRSPDTQWL